jgi:hypothetical protein
MRIGWKFLMVFASLCAGGILILASFDESVSSSYATRAEAVADGLFERGWLPDIVPASIRDIEMKNDLDLNISNGDFRFDPGDHDAFVSRLVRSAPDDRNGFSAYRFEDWTFWISSGKNRCRFHMRLGGDK